MRINIRIEMEKGQKKGIYLMFEKKSYFFLTGETIENTGFVRIFP